MSSIFRKITYEQQTKFNYFILGLAFAILGISVQTAEFGTYRVVKICELCSWLFLLICVFTGLALTIQMMNMARTFDELDMVNFELEEIKKRGEKYGYDESSNFPQYGGSMTFAAVVEKIHQKLKLIQDRQTAFYRKIRKLYLIVLTSLIIGIVFLIISRGSFPVKTLFSL